MERRKNKRKPEKISWSHIKDVQCITKKWVYAIPIDTTPQKKRALNEGGTISTTTSLAGGSQKGR